MTLFTWATVYAADGPIVGDGPDPKPRVTLPDESKYEPSEADGGGAATVHPRQVTAGQPCTLTLDYTVGQHGIATGGGVLCHVTHYWHWTPPQIVAADRPGYVTVSCSNTDVQLDVEVDSQAMLILARVRDGSLREGDRIRFVYGDTSDGKHPDAAGRADRFAEHGERFFFKVDGDGDEYFTLIEEHPRFDVVATDARRLAVFGPSRAAVGEPFELRVSALDGYNNRVASFRGSVRLKFDKEAVESPESVEMSDDDRGSVGVEVTARRAGMIKIRAAVEGDSAVAGESNVTWVTGSGEGKLKLYWADLQVHGNLSDGTGNPDDIYTYARDVANLDVCALTEHDHWGFVPLDGDDEAWASVLAASRKYDRPGEFVAFPAYEWTNWTFGHQHVLFAREEDARIVSWADPKTDHVVEFWKRLEGTDCVTIPHHPGGGPIPTCWKYHHPELSPAVEIVSIHGVSERMGAPGGIYRPEAQGMVQSALARGYRLGFLGSGDTHDGHPGLGTPGTPPPGLTGIYATSLTRDAILRAIRQRRTFATNGCRAVLHFHMNDTPMGGVARLNDREAERRFGVMVFAGVPVASVTLVKDNKDAVRFAGGSPMLSETWTDSEPAKHGDYYYARVRLTDGGMLWSSPIWIDCASE